MTVKELIDELWKYPPDTIVAVNVYEDQGLLNQVKLYYSDKAPYAKGDNVWATDDLPKNEPVLFLEWQPML